MLGSKYLDVRFALPLREANKFHPLDRKMTNKNVCFSKKEKEPTLAYRQGAPTEVYDGINHPPDSPHSTLQDSR